MLGTTADPVGRDEWSDHDFWIITKPGAQTRYLDGYEWLPYAGDILLTVRHGLSYRGVLFHSNHKVEYAVFDCDESAMGKIERFAVLIDRDGVQELAERIHRQTHEQRVAALAAPDKYSYYGPPAASNIPANG